MQGRYYELGRRGDARPRRTFAIRRELRERARNDLSQVNDNLARSRSRSCATRSSWRRCGRDRRARATGRGAHAQASSWPRAALAARGGRNWLPGSSTGRASIAISAPPDRAPRSESRAHRAAREPALRLQRASDRLSLELDALSCAAADAPIDGLSEREAAARAVADTLARELGGGAGAGAEAAQRAAARRRPARSGCGRSASRRAPN